MLTSPLPLSPPQPAPQVSTRPGPPRRPVPNVLRTATRSETGPPPASAILDSSALTLTLPPCPAPVRTHARTMGPCLRSGGGGDNIFVRCRQTGVTEKAPSLSPAFCYLSETEGVANLSECHLCFTIPLFVTQPPSTSCQGAITEDVEK